MFFLAASARWLLAEGVMLTSLKWLFSWPWRHGRRQNGWSWRIVDFCH